MFWVALLAGGFALWQQQTAAVDPGVVIRSTTSLVQVRVVVQDSKGKPVTDLQRGDFQIFDDRKAQPITFFTADRGIPAAVPTNLGGPDTAPASDSYSLIVLDWTNTEYPDRYRAKDHALHLLQTYQPRQKIALYLNGRNSRLLCDFTSDLSELVRVLETADLEFGDLDIDTRAGRFDARYGGRTAAKMTAEEEFFFLNKRITDTLRTFGLLADRLARLPGRKSLVWLSDAFPVTPIYYPELERVYGRLNRADVAVYGVDARGLSAASRSYSGTMIQFAERTGGTAFYDRNDLDEGLRLALGDQSISYVLGFHLPAKAAPGRHEIRVRVNRPHLQLRYRESYELGIL
jgi:VWFA-related protein